VIHGRWGADRIDHCVRAIEDARALARNSIDASFADADVKARLLEALARWRTQAAHSLSSVKISLTRRFSAP
jgi:adenosine deaminase